MCQWHEREVSSKCRPTWTDVFTLLQALAKSEISRCVIYGIAAENQQQLHRARVHVMHQIPKRRDLIDWLRLRADRYG